jgi:nucleotide-binding universal stress UspA family protein
MKNILVAVDLGESSKLLIDTAAELSKKFSAKVWVLHVAEPEPDFVGYDVGPRYIRINRAKDLRKEHVFVQTYTDQLKAGGIDADGLLIAGATVEMILEEMKKLEIDFVIMGHHKHSLMYKIFTGSVDTALVNKSKVPVLIVPI